MNENELKMIIEMKEDIASIKTTLDNMKNANATASEALHSAKSAHHRLAKIDKIIFWSATTIIGGVIIAVFALLWKSSN